VAKTVSKRPKKDKERDGKAPGIKATTTNGKEGGKREKDIRGKKKRAAGVVFYSLCSSKEKNEKGHS